MHTRKYSVIYLFCSWELEDSEFKEFVDIFEKLNTDLGNGLLADFIPMFKHIPTPGVRLVKKSVKLTFGMIAKFWKDYKENFDPGERLTWHNKTS